MRAPNALLASIATVALLAPAVPAAAQEYMLTLANGTTFSTRYRPEPAPWDKSKVLLLTDVGNWIALPKADVVSVASETETRGFGTVIDTTTIVLGWKPNDAPEPGEETPRDPMDRFLDFLRQQQGEQQDFSVRQFSEPSDAGQGGLPAFGLFPDRAGGTTSFPLGGSSSEAAEPEVLE